MAYSGISSNQNIICPQCLLTIHTLTASQVLASMTTLQRLQLLSDMQIVFAGRRRHKAAAIKVLRFARACKNDASVLQATIKSLRLLDYDLSIGYEMAACKNFMLRGVLNKLRTQGPFSFLCKAATLTEYGSIQGTELVAAGFPCIDVSHAGLRKGLNGQVRYAVQALSMHAC